jgi:hypothetical protein
VSVERGHCFPAVPRLKTVAGCSEESGAPNRRVLARRKVQSFCRLFLELSAKRLAFHVTSQPRIQQEDDAGDDNDKDDYASRYSSPHLCPHFAVSLLPAIRRSNLEALLSETARSL